MAPAPSAPATTTAPSALYTLDRHGAGLIQPLASSDGALGSGCTPGADLLPDGVWFGQVTAVVGDIVVFDLACLSNEEPARLSNSNPKLRELPLHDEAVYVGSYASVPVDEWSPGPSYVWAYVNSGLVTELSVPWLAYTLPSQATDPEWRQAVWNPPVTGGRCGSFHYGTPSPTSPWPTSGLPADGAYAVFLSIDGGSDDLTLTIQRYQPCTPDRCGADFEEGAMTIANDHIVRGVAFDENLTVLVKGIGVDPMGDPMAIEGSGPAFRALLDDMQIAWDTWLAPGGLEKELEVAEMTHSDPTSPWAYAPDGSPGFRGPLDTLIVDWFQPPPHFQFWDFELEIENGRPTIYIHAGLVAG